MQEPCCASWPNRQHTDHIYISADELHTPLWQHRLAPSTSTESAELTAGHF